MLNIFLLQCKTGLQWWWGITYQPEKREKVNIYNFQLSDLVKEQLLILYIKKKLYREIYIYICEYPKLDYVDTLWWMHSHSCLMYIQIIWIYSYIFGLSLVYVNNRGHCLVEVETKSRSPQRGDGLKSFIRIRSCGIYLF